MFLLLKGGLVVAFKYIVVALNIFSMLISGIILVALIVELKSRMKINRYLIPTVLSNMLMIMAYIFLFIAEDSNVNIYICYIAKFVYHICNLLTFNTFLAYILAVIDTRFILPKRYIKTLMVSSIVTFIITVILVTIQLQFIGDFNINTPLLILSIYPLVWALVDIIVVWIYRQYLKKIEVWYLISYLILPILSIILQFKYDGINLTGIAFAISLLILYICIQNQEGNLVKRKELEIEKQKIEIMLSQIQPHFLFNSLLVIGELCEVDPAETRIIVNKFAKYLRANLESLSTRTPISFEQELNHVKTYLEIEKKRFGDRLETEFDIQVKDFMIPTLTLQPIVENAVRHGVTKRKEGGKVTIKTSELNNYWCITVEDDGRGFDTDKEFDRTHIGLNNVRKRLKSMCNGELFVESTLGSGTIVAVLIPKKEAKNEYNIS